MFYLDWYLGLGLGLSVSGCDNGGKLHDQQENENMVQQSNESERSGDEEDV